MSSNGISDAAFAELKSSLAKSVGDEAAIRIRKVLANEQLVGESNVDAVRTVLRTCGTDWKLRELVADDVAWDDAVAAVFEHREMLKSVEGRTVLLVWKAAALIQGVAEHGDGDVVGLGVQARVGDARKRMIAAVVGVEVLRAIWDDGRDTAISPAERIAATMLTKREDVGLALAWAERVGIFTVRGTHAGSPRRGIRSLSNREMNRVAHQYASSIDALVESITEEPVSVIAMLDAERAKREVRRLSEPIAVEVDERLEARKTRAEAQREIDARKKSTPRGVMRGLDIGVVGYVVADLIIGADAIAWSASVPRPEGTLNAPLWLAMLRGSLGIKASKNITNSRLGAFGDKTLERLNQGELLSDMLALIGTWDGWQKREARLAEWAAGVPARSAARKQWEASKNAAESTVNSLLAVTGRIPKPNASLADKEAWEAKARELVEAANLDGAYEFNMSKRLARRMVSKGWGGTEAKYAANKVFDIFTLDEPAELGAVII